METEVERDVEELVGPPDVNKLATEEAARKDLMERDGIDFLSLNQEFGGIIDHLQQSGMALDDNEKVFIGLTVKELEAMTEMIPILQENFGEDSEDTWVDQLGMLCELMEGDNFIERMAFIETDYDYSVIAKDCLMEFLQEKGQNDRKEMYDYLKIMHNIFQKHSEHAHMLEIHDEASKTQPNDIDAPDAAKNSAHSPMKEDGATEMLTAGQAAS